jgi:hypothetical protein
MAYPNRKRETQTGGETYALWQTRVTSALRYRKDHPNGDQAWKDGYEMFKGNHWGIYNASQDRINSATPNDLITVNITGSNVRSLLPFLVNRNPRIIAKPRRAEFIVSAALQQEILNYEWRERRMQRQIKRVVLDTVICGHGICKTGFNLEIDESKNKKRDGVLEFRDYVKKEAPYIKRVSPFKFISDPEAPEHDLNTSRWCAEIFFKRPEDVLANARYAQDVLTKVRRGDYQPGCIPTYEARNLDASLASLQDSYGEDRELWVLYELWDKKFEKYYVFLDGVEPPILEKATPYDYLDGLPYTRCDFINVPDEPYPLGLPAWIKDQQFELNRVRTRWFQHGRRFNRKYEVLAGVLGTGSREILESGEDGSIVEVEEMGRIKPIDDARVSNDQNIIESLIKQDIRELSGLDELARGGNLQSRATATEVEARTGLLNLKTDEHSDAVDSFVFETVTQVSQHVKANYVTEKVVQLTGPRGQFWVSYSKEDIQGEVDLQIETVSAPKTDPEREKAQALQVFQLIMQNLQTIMQIGQVQMDIGALIKWILEKVAPVDAAQFFPALAQQGPALPQPGANGTVPAAGLDPALLQANRGQAAAARAGQQGAQASGGTSV